MIQILRSLSDFLFGYNNIILLINLLQLKYG